MTINNATVDTLPNWAKGRDPDSMKAAEVIEMLNQSNEIPNYLPWMTANAPFLQRTTARVELPTVSTRQLGQGIPMSTSRVDQFDDTMSIMDVFNEIDIKLAQGGGDVGQYRYNAGLPFYEALYQKFSNLFFYGNSNVVPSDFNGMATRYSTVTAANSANAQNVLDAGGTASANASIWLLTFSAKSLIGIFPAGSPAGLYHKDWGEQLNTVTAGYGGTVLPVYKDQYQWTCGITVPDWRWNVRIANIDVNNLVAESGAADLFKLMNKAMFHVPSISYPPSTTGNPMSSISPPGISVWVMNRTMQQMLSVQASNKVSNQLMWGDYQGRKIQMFQGMPIINTDQLTNTESQVT